MTRYAIIAAAVWCIGMGLFVGANEINRWEKANGYPYGHMCNSIFTGYVNTCPVK